MEDNVINLHIKNENYPIYCYTSSNAPREVVSKPEVKEEVDKWIKYFNYRQKDELQWYEHCAEQAE